MAYHVSILRTQKGSPWPITKAEVESLSARNSAFQTGKSNLGECELAYFVDGEVRLSLTLQDGELWTANPGEQEMLLMLDIARQLNARVRGDEFETYATLDRTFLHPDDTEEVANAAAFEANLIRKVRRDQIILNASLLAVFALLILLLYLAGALR